MSHCLSSLVFKVTSGNLFSNRQSKQKQEKPDQYYTESEAMK